MRLERTLKFAKWLAAALILAAVCPAPATAQAPAASGRKAGEISALIPVDHVQRRKARLEATKGMPVEWGDIILTERGGRVRVKLDDGSILNVGSQSQLKIEQHDAQVQRTSLELAYGRMRASVVRIARPDQGGFTVRTAAAVAGVVGTDAFWDAAQIFTTVIAMGGGDVTVGSTLPQCPDPVLLFAGEAVTMLMDRCGVKRLATEEELEAAFSETDVDEVLSLRPRRVAPGRTANATIVGRDLGAADGVTFQREGLRAEIVGQPGAAEISVRISVAAGVPAGSYPFTVTGLAEVKQGLLVVATDEQAKAAAASKVVPPTTKSVIATRGAKFALDASGAQAPPGTQIVGFLWRIIDTDFSSTDPVFRINTSLLKPGEYTVSLLVVSDRGQVATQTFPLVVQTGKQPAEIIRSLAQQYDSLQPGPYLTEFHEQDFPNYAGFAAAIEDSFRNQLETVRVFQRPVNCTINEEIDQAICQADFEVQFTKKDQPTEFLDSNGNPFPPGVPAPPGSTQGKRILTGTERATIRFGRSSDETGKSEGWKIVLYNAEVSCPGGNATTGLNVGSCILALGSFSTPGFQLFNVQLPSGNTLQVGAPFTGSFDISPLGGFNGAVTFTGVANIGGSFGTVTFSPNPSPSLGTVTFTLTAPTVGPNQPTPFDLVITGTDSSGALVQTITIPLTFQGAQPFIISQFSTATTPLTILANSSTVIGITVQQGQTSFNQPVTISFGPLPAGVTVTPSTANVFPGSTQNFTFSFTPTGNPVANFGTTNVTVTASAPGFPTQTSTIVLALSSATSLPFALSAGTPGTITLPSGATSTSFNVFVSSAVTFNQPINISVSGVPTGVNISPGTFVFTPGLSGTSVNYSVNVNASVAVPGVYPITIVGVSGGLSTTTTTNLTIRGSVSLALQNPNTITTPLVLPPDGTTQTNIDVVVTSVGGFSGSVTVSFSNPFGTAVTVTPGTSVVVNVPANGSATATFTLVAQTTAVSTGTTSAFISASATLGAVLNNISGPFMTIGPAGFNLSTTSSFTGTVDINSPFSVFTVSTTVQPLGNFSGSVQFTVQSGTVPAGVTISPITQTVAATGTATFRISAVSPAVSGTYAILVDAVGSTGSRLFTINFRLRGSLALSVVTSPGGGLPGTQTVPLVLSPGSSLAFTVSVTAQNGYQGSATLDAFNLPSGVTAVFSSSGTSSTTLAVPGTDTLTLTASLTVAQTSLAQVFVEAFDPTSTFSNTFPTESIYLTTGSPTFNLVCDFFGSPVTCDSFYFLNLNINQAGSSDSISLRIEPQGGYNGTVTVVPQNMPAGISMTPNPVTLTVGRPVTVTFTAASPITAGLFNFDLVGTDTITPTMTSSQQVSGQANGSLKLVMTPATTSSTPALLAPGGSQTFTVDVFGMNGFSGTADIFFSFSGATGVSLTGPSTQTVVVPPTGSVQTSFTLTAASNAPASTVRSISVSGNGRDASFNTITYFVSGESSVSGNYAVGPATFSLTTTTARLNSPLFLVAGGQVNFSITVTPIGAYSGTVNFDVTGLPAGVTVSSAQGSGATIPVQQGIIPSVFEPIVTSTGVTPASSVSTTIFFSASTTTPRGFVQATLLATDGTISQTIPIALFIVPQVTLNTTPAATVAAPMVIAPGGSAQLQIAATASPTFAGDLDVTFGLPSEITISPVATIVNIGGFSTVTVNLANTVTVGTQLSFTIQARLNGSLLATRTVNIVAGQGAFSIAVSPSTALSSTTPLVVQAGGASVNVGVQVNAIGNFTGSVSINATFSVASLSTPTATQNATAGQTVNFPVSAAAGSQGLIARMFINATGGGQSTSATVFISIGSGGYSITPQQGAASTSPISLNIGSTSTFSLLIHQQSGFSGTITLTLSGLPSGVTVRNNGVQAIAGTVQSFTLIAAANAIAGDHQFTLTGQSPGLTDVVLTLFLKVNGDFTMAISPGATSGAPLVIAPGGPAASFQVSVTPTTSFFGSVQVSFSTFNLPAGITISPSSATATPGTPADFTISAAAGVAPGGVVQIFFSAFGSHTITSRQASLFFTVGATPTFNVGFSGAIFLNINDPNGSNINVSITPVGGYSGTVTLSVGTLPTGIVANPPSTTQPISGFGSNISLQFTANSNAAPGQFTVSLSVTDGTITVNQNLTVNVFGNFQMTATPSNQQNNPILLLPGQSQLITINVQSLNNYAACGSGTAIALQDFSSLPTGVTIALSPTADISAPGTATVSVAAGAPASGVFSVQVGGPGNPDCTQDFQTITVFFTVGPGGFSIPTSFGTVSVNIGSGSLSTTSVTVTPLGNFAGTVTFTVTSASVPAGVTVTPMTAVVQAGSTQNFQVRADPPATAGSAQFQFSVTDGTTTLNGTIPLQLRGSYTLTITPANTSASPAVVAPGQSVIYTVTVNPLNGFTGTVDLSRSCFFCGSPPSGVSVTVSLQASTSSPGQIVVTASQSAVPTGPSGVLFLTSSANSFSSPSFNFFSAVGPPVFRVSNGTSVQFPTSIVIDGATRNIFVNVSSLGAYSGTVTLTLGQLPAGLTASPQTGQVFVPSGSSAGFTFTFQATSPLPQGPIDVSITGSDGTNTFNTFVYMFAVSNIALVSNPPSSNTAPLRLIPGDTVGQTVSIQVLSVGGFTGSIPLTVTSNPSNLTIVPSPNPPVVLANGSADFQVTAATGAAGGLTSITIQASFGGISQSINVFFFIGVGSFTMSTSPPSSSTNPVALDPNGTTVVPITVDVIPQQGFLGSVDVTPQALPAGVTVSPASVTVNVTSANPVSATFNFSATVSQGLTPITVTFDGASTVQTSAGPVLVTAQTQSFLLVNPPSFTMSQSAGTSANHISLEQGIPPGATFQITVTGLGGFTGSVTISFANVPTGMTISPTTATVAAGGTVTFTVDTNSTAALGSFIIPVIGTSGVESASLSLFVDVVQPTNGFFLSTSPSTSAATPLLLQPDSTLITFLNVNVTAKGTFTGMVNLALSGVPTGVTANLSASSVDLSVSPSQFVVATFQTSTGLAPFGPVAVIVTGTSGSLQATIGIQIALQTTSAIANPGEPSASVRTPQVESVRPAMGLPGSHIMLFISGESLDGVTQVMSISPAVVPRLEPGGTEKQVRVNIFVRPTAEPGPYSILLLTPRGAVPVGFTVMSEVEQDGELPRNARPLSPYALRGRGRIVTDGDAPAARPQVTRVEPASLKPGEVVEGRIVGQRLEAVAAIRVAGAGIAIEILEKSDTELRVRFSIAATAPSGARLMMLEAGKETIRAPLQIGATARVAAGPRTGVRNMGEAPDSANATESAGTLDLAVRASDITMSPANPRAGDTVTFRVRVSNLGTKRVEDAEVEFALAGTSVKARERISLDPGASQSLQFEWQAEGAGRIEPSITLDPDSRLSETDRGNNSAELPAFELVAAATSGGKPDAPQKALPRERGQLAVLAGTCQGFRFTSGTEQSCGGADVEFHVSAQGATLRMEAEGVRNLGAVDLDSVRAMPKGALASAESLQAGSTYVVATRRGSFVLRVSEIRGLEALRNAPAAPLARPRVSDLERDAAAPKAARITLVLEWRQL
jgi:hypothetical protein